MSEQRIPIRFELIKAYPGVGKNKLATREGIVRVKKEMLPAFIVIGDGGKAAIRLIEYFLPEYWKPVYEEDKKYDLPYTNAKNERTYLPLTIRDGKVHYGDYSFSARMLEGVLLPCYARSSGKNREDVRFTPIVFNMGCLGQYEYIARESIQELIDLIKGEEKSLRKK